MRITHVIFRYRRGAMSSHDYSTGLYWSTRSTYPTATAKWKLFKYNIYLHSYAKMLPSKSFSLSFSVRICKWTPKGTCNWWSQPVNHTGLRMTFATTKARQRYGRDFIFRASLWTTATPASEFRSYCRSVCGLSNVKMKIHNIKTLTQNVAVEWVALLRLITSRPGDLLFCSYTNHLLRFWTQLPFYLKTAICFGHISTPLSHQLSIWK